MSGEFAWLAMFKLQKIEIFPKENFPGILLRSWKKLCFGMRFFMNVF